MKCDELKTYGMADEAIDEEYEMYKVAEVDAAIEELKAENESLLQQNRELCQALQVMYSEEEYKKLQRALWLARAELCHRLDIDRYLRNHRNSWYNENCFTWADACVAMDVKMCKAESKCRAKADQYR